MYFVFLWEVLKRAFTPAPRVTDMLQILAASALPAAGNFAGLELPANASENALAYIGLIALGFVIIRLFWAPYAIWKEQAGDIGSLKLELSKPERMVHEHFAKLRAKARMKLSRRLSRMHLAAFARDKEDGIGRLAVHNFHVQRLAHNAGLPVQFVDAIKALDDLCEQRIMGKFDGDDDFDLLDAMQRYLSNEITIESLALRLPPDIEQKTQP